MPLGNPTAGTGYAAEFQSSALPWMTSSTAPASGSPTRYTFPMVSRFITLVNQSTGSLSLGVTWRGVATSSNKVIVPAASSISFEWRVTQVFVQSEGAAGGSFSLAVGLTTVPQNAMPQLTGSAPDGTNWQGVG